MVKLRGITVGIIFIFLLHRAVPAGDTWWSLRVGRELFQGISPYREHWSWTAFGAFNPDHEWLWSALIYLLWLAAAKHLWLIFLLHALLLSLPFFLFWPKSQKCKEFTTALAYLALLPAFVYLDFMDEIRAQDLSFFLFALCMFLLKNRGQRRIYCLPLIFLLWANMHGGVFLGIILLCLTIGLELVKHMKKKQNYLKKLSFVTVLSLGATFANPLGWGLWTYIVGNGSKVAVLNVIEWQHVWFTAHSLNVWLWLTLLLTLTIIVLRRQISSVALPLGASIVFSILGFWVIRFLPFMLLSITPLTIVAFHHIKILPTKQFNIQMTRWLGNATAMVLALAIVFFTYSDERQAEHVGIPVAAQKKLATCGPHVYNDYNSGAFLLWWMPAHRVFQDNRADPYPKAVLAYTDLTLDNLASFNHRWPVRCAFTFAHSPTDQTLNTAGWRRIYNDGVWVVWSRV